MIILTTKAQKALGSTLPSAGVCSRDAAFKPTWTYSRRPAEGRVEPSANAHSRSQFFSSYHEKYNSTLYNSPLNNSIQQELTKERTVHTII